LADRSLPLLNDRPEVRIYIDTGSVQGSETIPIYPEMGLMLGTILRLTLKPERVEAVLGGVDLHASLEALRERWLTFLVDKSATT